MELGIADVLRLSLSRQSELHEPVGLNVNSPEGDTSLPVAYATGRDMPPSGLWANSRGVSNSTEIWGYVTFLAYA